MRHTWIIVVVLFGLAGNAAAGEILDNEKIIKLVKSGLEEEILLRKLERDVCNFKLDTNELIRLKEADVSGLLIMAMMDKMDTQVNKTRVQIEMLIQILRTSDPEEYYKTVRKLKRHGAEAVPALTARLSDIDEVIRAGVAEVLGEIGDVSAKDVLIEALNDDHNAVRAKVAKAVANMSDEATIEKLLKWIKTPGRHRDGAALALGYLREKRAIKPLTALVEDHLAAEDDRASAAFALGLVGEVASLDKLIEILLSSPSNKIRETAAKAIGRIGPYYGEKEKEAAAKALTRAFDRYPQNRAAVARVLGDFPLAGVISTLIEGLNDQNPEISDACYKSLKALTGETLGRNYDEWSSWWQLSKVRYQLK